MLIKRSFTDRNSNLTIRTPVSLIFNGYGPKVNLSGYGTSIIRKLFTNDYRNCKILVDKVDVYQLFI